MGIKRVNKNHPLSHLVPERRYAPREDGGEYVSRVIHGVLDVDLMQYARDTQKPVLMFGDTGPGKTSMVMAFAAKMGIPVVTVMCNGGVDPSTFWCQPVPDPEKGFVMQDADPLTVVENGGILYFDELNFLPAKNASPVNSLIDGRRFITVVEQGNRVVKAHEDLMVIGTYNPDYEGTRPLNEALKNRFKMKLPIDYDADVEAELVAMPVMLEIATQLRSRRANGDIKTPVSTNMLMEFEQFTMDIDLEFAVANFIAAFLPEEREAIQTVFELNSHTLQVQVADL